MNRIAPIAALVLLGVAVSWGCQQALPPTASTGLGALEVRVGKLEKDVKAAEQARDAAAAKALAAEQRYAGEHARLVLVEGERDAAAKTLKSRTAEKEQLATQMDGFRKNLKELLARVETAAAGTAPDAVMTLPLAR